VGTYEPNLDDVLSGSLLALLARRIAIMKQLTIKAATAATVTSPIATETTFAALGCCFISSDVANGGPEDVTEGEDVSEGKDAMENDDVTEGEGVTEVENMMEVEVTKGPADVPPWISVSGIMVIVLGPRETVENALVKVVLLLHWSSTVRVIVKLDRINSTTLKQFGRGAPEK